MSNFYKTTMAVLTLGLLGNALINSDAKDVPAKSSQTVAQPTVQEKYNCEASSNADFKALKGGPVKKQGLEKLIVSGKVIAVDDEYLPVWIHKSPTMTENNFDVIAQIPYEIIEIDNDDLTNLSRVKVLSRLPTGYQVGDKVDISYNRKTPRIGDILPVLDLPDCEIKPLHSVNALIVGVDGIMVN